MVIKQVKQWFVARANAARWKAVAEWADDRGAQFKLSRDARGFVVEHQRHQGNLRIEWGPSQRSYIDGYELRIRAEARLNSELQMLVLDKTLMERLEKEVFEAYTDTLRTRVDTDTPEEMRWLVMFPKLRHIASKLVRQHFGVLGVNQELPTIWLDGLLSDLLAQASQDLLAQGRPFVLMCQRGNVYLRCAMNQVVLADIQQLLKLAEVAVQESQRVNVRLQDGGPWPTTTSVAWQTRPPEADVPF
ncbi:hypothetical protein RQP53_01660 [Paucibacter sp. APW11]|uniref:Uncharacterized protein n=1 Tax=Roseateles aquae TaxID=3077235 RepID=A0ABU3P8B1_9BURK|nr:hypothetical protein [Paucibacter sp. APW11]MDT8997976.1 hypothetical protein [Paucibacter sp. APW11]